MPEGKGYSYTSSGTNSQVYLHFPCTYHEPEVNMGQGNHYCSRDYGSGSSSSNSYHYSNTNGSYYYSNPNGSTYYNSGSGYSNYSPPSGNSEKK
ncbi:hypothetical protein N7523_001513 [Penicillium sp. IBT 18751x]|nr:hypothetical protein N7523_001513 [Penicillium sp. IBT 18751x]